jgi:hypothetical protein
MKMPVGDETAEPPFFAIASSRKMSCEPRHVWCGYQTIAIDGLARVMVRLESDCSDH